MLILTNYAIIPSFIFFDCDAGAKIKSSDFKKSVRYVTINQYNCFRCMQYFLFPVNSSFNEHFEF